VVCWDKCLGLLCRVSRGHLVFLVRKVERQSGMVGKVTLVCGVWEAFEHGGPVGQLLIVDGTEV
jgi:hypothetical protein